MPVCSVTRAPASPDCCTDSTRSSSPSVLASAFGSLAVAMMSRSLTESARPAQRAGHLDAVRRRVGAQHADDLLGDGDRAREQHARRRPAAVLVVGEHLLEVLLDLGAEAAQPADLARLRRRAQRVERVDAELVVEPPRPLGPEAGQVHHRDQPRRELGAELLGGGDVAGLVERAELLLERLADARDVGHAPLARHRHHRHRGVAHGLGGVAVGDDPVADTAPSSSYRSPSSSKAAAIWALVRSAMRYP